MIYLTGRQCFMHAWKIGLISADQVPRFNFYAWQLLNCTIRVFCLFLSWKLCDGQGKPNEMSVWKNSDFKKKKKKCIFHQNKICL